MVITPFRRVLISCITPCLWLGVVIAHLWFLGFTELERIGKLTIGLAICHWIITRPLRGESDGAAK